MRIGMWRSGIVAAAAMAALACGTSTRLGADEVRVVKLGAVTGYRLLDLQWSKGPFPGSRIAVLAGDPAAGMHHSYLELADGTVVAPHWHSSDEYVTVVSGTVLVGQGDKVDESAMRLFGPGAFIHIPPKTAHYARAKGPVVLSQTRGGAMDVHWVNPDDPAKAPATANPATK